MNDEEYQASLADFAQVVNRLSENLEPRASRIEQLDDAEVDKLATQLRDAFDEVLTFLEEAEQFGKIGKMELLIQVTRQLENLSAARAGCAQILAVRNPPVDPPAYAG